MDGESMTSDQSFDMLLDSSVLVVHHSRLNRYKSLSAACESSSQTSASFHSDSIGSRWIDSKATRYSSPRQTMYPGAYLMPCSRMHVDSFQHQCRTFDGGTSEIVPSVLQVGKAGVAKGSQTRPEIAH